MQSHASIDFTGPPPAVAEVYHTVHAGTLMSRS